MNDDVELMRQICSKSENAFAELQKRYSGAIWVSISRAIQEKDLHFYRDAAQEAWLLIWNKACSFDPNRGIGVGGWLKTVARNSAISLARKVNKKNKVNFVEPNNLPDRAEEIAPDRNEGAETAMKECIEYYRKQGKPREKRDVEIFLNIVLGEKTVDEYVTQWSDEDNVRLQPDDPKLQQLKNKVYKRTNAGKQLILECVGRKLK